MRWLRAVCPRALLFIALALGSGCKTAAYYGQAARGQWQILAGREPIGKLLADEKTPEKLQRQLRLVLQLREFAERELKLPVDGHYERYVDVGRPFVVWNVQATPEFSLRPRTWWYPIVGRVKYRGFFSEADARAYAATLAGQDVYVEGVRAYSTLGWFKDPVLNTFVNHEELDLAQLLFHELGHQRLFVSGDTDFNEAFATAVGEEGVRRWLQIAGRSADWEQYRVALAERLNSRPVDKHRACARTVDAGDQVDQRGFAAAGLADDGDELARRQGQVHAVQGSGAAIGPGVELAEFAQFDHGACGL